MEESKGAHRNMTPLLSFLFVRRNGYEEDRTHHQTREALATQEDTQQE